MAIEIASVSSQRGEDLPPLRFLDSGPPRPARHIVFYRRDALSYERKCELEQAPAGARLAMAEPWLDAGNGECGLTDDETASNLAFAIRTSSARFDILAWCIMPSHVHVLMFEQPNTELIEIVRHWMASAETIEGAILQGAPSVWDTRFFAEEGSGAAWIAAVGRQIEGNPVAAGLASSPGSWRWSSASKYLGPLSRGRRAPQPLSAPTPRPEPAPTKRKSVPPRRALHVIFWLDDALPGGVLWELSRREPATQPRFLDRALDKALDKARGRQSLARRVAAVQVRDEMLSGDGVRYGLIAWCVMPTHVHVLFQEVKQWPPTGLVERWKSKTIAAANVRRLFRIGASPWAKGYAKAEIIGDEAIEDTRSYIEHNPVMTGLSATPHAWPWSSAWSGRNQVARP